MQEVMCLSITHPLTKRYYLQLDVQSKAQSFPLFLVLVGSEITLLAFTAAVEVKAHKPEQ